MKMPGQNMSLPYENNFGGNPSQINNPEFVMKGLRGGPKPGAIKPAMPALNAGMPKMAYDEKAFWTGFCEKCASLKVDPLELVKLAKPSEKQAGFLGNLATKAEPFLARHLPNLSKNVVHDMPGFLGSRLGSLLTNTGGTASTVGALPWLLEKLRGLQNTK